MYGAAWQNTHQPQNIPEIDRKFAQLDKHIISTLPASIHGISLCRFIRQVAVGEGVPRAGRRQHHLRQLVVLPSFRYLRPLHTKIHDVLSCHVKIQRIMGKSDHKNTWNCIQNKYDSWLSIALSLIFWGSFYQILLKTLRTKSPEYCCRIITFVHGCFVAFVGVNQCFLIDNPFDHPEWKTTRLQKFILVSSLGYFVHDLLWCLLYERDSKLMIVHHTYSVCALYRMLFKGYSGAQATCALGSMEITNPFLQCRWFLRTAGFYPSTIHAAMELTFVLIFFFVRILLGSYFLVVIILQPRNDWDFKVFAVVIYVMSWMFMVNISKYISKRYRRAIDSDEYD